MTMVKFEEFVSILQYVQP